MLLTMPGNPLLYNCNPMDHVAGCIQEAISKSDHSYEHTVLKLLLGLAEYRALGLLADAQYYAALGTALDVLDYFNYDIEMLAIETNGWYRASVVHQMGCGMLQALEQMRPDLSTDPLFTEALAGLRIGRPHNDKAWVQPGCKRWVGERTRRKPARRLSLIVNQA